VPDRQRARAGRNRHRCPSCRTGPGTGSRPRRRPSSGRRHSCAASPAQPVSSPQGLLMPRPRKNGKPAARAIRIGIEHTALARSGASGPTTPLTALPRSRGLHHAHDGKADQRGARGRTNIGRAVRPGGARPDPEGGQGDHCRWGRQAGSGSSRHPCADRDVPRLPPPT